MAGTFKNCFAIFLLLMITGCATSNLYKIDAEEVAKTLLPKDLRKSNRILLLKVPSEEKKDIDNLNKFMTAYYSGKFEIVNVSRSIDKYYPDTSVYKYVLVIAGAIKEYDFQGISNKEIFFDKTDGSFSRSGSSLYIFDRSSNHDLYETGEKAITIPVSGRDKRGIMIQYDAINYQKLRNYLEVLENY